MKKNYTIIAIIISLVSFGFTAFTQNINIPDPAFKAVLVGNPNINTNADTEIQTSEATAYTGTIDCSNASITNLTGIEAFTQLTELNCSNNMLATLNLSANTALTKLFCAGNILYNLNLSTNTALSVLDCGANKLTTLDLLANTALTEFYCGGNQTLTSLKIPASTILTIISCANTQISTLNLSANPALTTLFCCCAKLNTLNLSANPALVMLRCGDNFLTDLDLSGNPALKELNCVGNSITNLDLSANTQLTTLSCVYNALTELNIQNGNNHNIQSFNANNNPTLTCIQVDNVAYANANFTLTNTPAEFSLDCTTNAIQPTTPLSPTTISITPNPSTGTFTIVPPASNAPLQIQVLNAVGKMVLTTQIAPNQPSTLNLQNQPKGVYFLVTKQKNGTNTTQKIVIQ